MGELSSSERKMVERAAAEPMLDQVLAWAAVNSGSRNLGGLERMADLLTDAFAALPGVLRLENPATVEAVDAGGRTIEVRHGRHLHLPNERRVRRPIEIALVENAVAVVMATAPSSRRPAVLTPWRIRRGSAPWLARQRR